MKKKRLKTGNSDKLLVVSEVFYPSDQLIDQRHINTSFVTQMLLAKVFQYSLT